MPTPSFQRVVIIGVGLLGSSLGMNLIRRRLAQEVIGVGRNEVNLKTAFKKGAIHSYQLLRSDKDIRAIVDALTEHDLVVLSSPVNSIFSNLSLLSQKPLVIDVGSTKQKLMKKAHAKKLRFVGCHPIAGTEHNGAAFGDINLYQKKKCILMKDSKVSVKDMSRVTQLWKACGSEIHLMTSEEHDKTYAALSHLPHAMVYSLIEAVSHLVSLETAHQLALGGLKGTTRIAESSPEMWRDIFLQNKKFVLRALNEYQKVLKTFEKYLKKSDEKKLLSFLQKSQKKKIKIG